MFTEDIDRNRTNSNILPDNDKNLLNIQDEIDLLHYWKKFAKRYSILHAKSCYYYKTINTVTMVPVILLTIAGGFLNIIFADQCSEFIYILIGVLQLIVAFLTGLYNFFRIPELQESHNLHYLHFLKLENNIKVQLLIGDTKYKEFANLYVYVVYVKEELNRLIDSAPPIPEKIIDKYNKTVTDEDLFLEKKKELIKTNNYIKDIIYKPNTDFVKESKSENLIISKNTNNHLNDNQIIEDKKENYTINIGDTDLIKDLEKQKRQLQKSLNSIILNI